MSYTPEYRAFIEAKSRCNNPNRLCFKEYGKRGIQFKFESFADWLAEVGKRPTPKHSIDRKDNDGHYEAGNLKWSTKSEQLSNRRKFVGGRFGKGKGYYLHRGLYLVRIMRKGVYYNVGSFASKAKAVAAYKSKLAELNTL